MRNVVDAAWLSAVKDTVADVVLFDTGFAEIDVGGESVAVKVKVTWAELPDAA